MLTVGIRPARSTATELPLLQDRGLKIDCKVRLRRRRINEPDVIIAMYCMTKIADARHSGGQRGGPLEKLLHPSKNLPKPRACAADGPYAPES